MQAFDVIIVGRGITGLSTAFHLKRHGIKSVCIIGPNRQFSNCVSINSGYAAISLQDNISRAVHGHGSHVAQDLLRLNQRGYAGLIAQASSYQVPFKEGVVYRTTTSEMEINEMKSATEWLQSHGFPALIGETQAPHPLLTFQSDGSASASIDISNLLNRMESSLGWDTLIDQVERIIPGGDHITVQTTKGKALQSQVVVAANHLGIKKLVPKLESCLVNHADQWSEFEFSGHHPLIERGNLLFCDFGQYWLSVGHNNKIRAGGARFLRKWSGIEAESAETDPNIANKVRDQIQKYFGINLLEADQQFGIVDLRSCDEIPIIGPMYDDSRILVASGFMGSGLTMGFAAGSGLADFILHGKSKFIPEIFHPKRLRSLPDVP